MPVTRQETGKRAASEQTPTTSSEGTATTGASSEEGSATTADTSQTAATSSSAKTATLVAPITLSEAQEVSPPPVAEVITPSNAPTLLADAPVTGSQNQGGTVRKEPRAASIKGGGGSVTYSKTRALQLAKKKQELLRLRLELAAADIAVIEAEEALEETEDEDASVHSAIETDRRVDKWLEQQPSPVQKTKELPPTEQIEEPAVSKSSGHREQPEDRPSPGLQPPAGAQPTATELAAAITLAVRTAQQPRYSELPFFGGSHNEWLPFRAAYYETEGMFSAIDNTNRLRRNLKGKAREAVEGLLFTGVHPTDIMKTLESRFGRPEAIATVQMETLRGLSRLTESPRDLCVFATKVSNVVATLKALKCAEYMYNPELVKTIVEKLTPTLRFRYYDFVETQLTEEPNLVKIERFLSREADRCRPFAAPEHTEQQFTAVQHRRPQKVHSTTEATQTSKCLVCQQEGHTVPECGKFKKEEPDQRWDIAKSRKLCFRCLHFRNRSHNCKAKTCGIDGCNRLHHKLLHYIKIVKKEDTGTTEAINSAWTIEKKQSYLKIIPVRVEGPSGTVNTYALMDDGSTVSLIDNSIAEQIGARGPVDPLRIETISDSKTAEEASRRVKIKLCGPNKHEEEIQARTVRNLQVSSQQVPRKLVEGCRHLADIKKYIVYANAKPRILIGQDNWHLLLTTEVRKGNSEQPVASLTPLGWVLHGSKTRTIGRTIDFVSHIRETEDSLENLVKQYFEMDALCLQPRRPKTDPEEQALRILEKNTTKIEGRFQTGLLWRTEDVQFPDNYGNSLKRLLGIEKKIDKDPQLKMRYTEQMEALISKGYAEPAPTEKTPRTWYLPHFAVTNPMKPDKLRVVHDAAAKTQGVSLNDMLHKGPDLLQSLPGVIMRFRQHEIAVTADIKEMFMQVKLRPEDRDALRYLWRGNRRDQQPPEEYRMTSLIFGASSSPATAIYVKNLNATQHADSHPEAAAAIIEKHYVDDYLDSFKSAQDAVRITQGVREVHAKAGFELKQWKSNSTEVLEALGEASPIEDTHAIQTEQAERVLGVIWKISTDELAFNLDLGNIAPTLAEDRTPTKREALRIVMSLFDPLGFASPITVRAKQILQEVWRRGTLWDTAIDPDLAVQWQEWMSHLKNLRNVKIPRRYLHYSDATSLQLHIFTDASEAAYSAIVYWRTVAPNGEIGVSLVVAKARVAPLKLTSIPRLELQAAVLGTRLATTVIEEHRRKPDCRIFWTDSRTALTWIRTGSRSYKPYVAHRLAEIEETTKVSEWRWVPTKINVADDATRDVPTRFDKDHRWYRGPDFLYETEDYWPTETTGKIEPSGEEKVNHITEQRRSKLAEALPDVARFSNWNRLRYTTARVVQFIELCRAEKEKINYRRTKKNTEKDPTWKKQKRSVTQQQAKTKIATSNRRFLPVTAEDLRRAEELLMRSSQEDSFAEDIEALKNKGKMSKDSRLHQLSVEYTEDTVKLRSRIQATQHITEELRNPTVIDGNHPTVKLWIQDVHRQLHHAGVEATINECRQQYWILRVRPVTKTIVRNCLFCRMKTQTPPYPRTGDLPACRLAHHQRPFTYTGLDYFGPLSVAVGRTRQKRYVAIFTCLTMRAIHLEIANSLSADSAVMALRRMIARRGCPTEIWSDNGTNLKAADKELRQAIDSATTEEAAKKKISWRFIPPGAPFMGGAWERMVRSVKTALTATLHERHPTEEVLSTLLTEVEYTVNSRPLTHVSVSTEDPEALTPNHFLLGGPARVPQPGTFDERDIATKSSWRASQRLADIFWARWVKECLPELQHRREPHGRGPAIQSGDLVQIIDANLPRNVWIRGRVITTYPGPDNIVRTVDVQTRGGVLRRPVRKLVILPLPTTDVPAPREDATASHGGRDVQDNDLIR